MHAWAENYCAGIAGFRSRRFRDRLAATSTARSVSRIGIRGTRIIVIRRQLMHYLPDDMVRDYVFENIIYRAGVRSIVAWWNNPALTPPIERLEGRIFNVGLAAINSIAKTDQAFYWLGDDFVIYRASGGVEERISTDAISNELQKYSRVDDAIANTFTFQGQNFYQITFPTGTTLPFPAVRW